ncbi:MAG: helix-turn-helix transcriptional regulator [Planctomycetaceae bacterium]|nr:helix-turn-helix transcriptional regulator [Planctomycetaceae bacterium]
MYCNLFTARYCLGVLALCLLTYLILLPFGPKGATAAFGFLGFLGLLPFFWFGTFRKEKYDERDLCFVQRSISLGLINLVAALYPTAAILHFIYRIASGYAGNFSIPSDIFWLPLLVGGFVGLFVGSVTLLVLYHKGEEADKGLQAALGGLHNGMGKITNTVHRLRFDRDEMTQEELAKRAGVSCQTIIAIESGKYTPSLGLAFKLATIFNCSVEEIFCVVDEPSQDG